ncbi:hypothetical protein [Methylobacterium longum]|uniref:Uncharacterized protein n=2 Tax=Methylobacterium longum TaxID=767694 RepID=A0ABT8ASG5_9HYPH|nr:hypothetical protein [Methylobacterium longum]MDN3572356.1 hypothetical protein [Methylobacterium longum]GJE09500.1 hypothetical protein FOHLNKBM_0524 [Methylobacterium longum]
MMVALLLTALVTGIAANISLVVFVADHMSPDSNSGTVAPTLAGRSNTLAAA